MARRASRCKAPGAAGPRGGYRKLAP
jgi:hypothetical protein